MKHSNTKPGFCLSAIRFRDFSFLLILLTSLSGFAQFRISGKTTTPSGEKLPFVEIYNKTNSVRTNSDGNGNFSFEVKSEGAYELSFYKDEFQVT
ncbi:hypothetical protein [Flavobacterium sp. 3HN19-14]|uniref:hypothetical protein n=1 Tax=Flavobacterium sp. 3HN19-14 TaxID=3448133 RepID=UPI003EDF45E8